jgi:predicted secreted protein
MKHLILARACYFFAPLTLIGLLSGCGGGGGGGDNGPSVKQGQFIDSAVEGLQYESGGQIGVTDENGTFLYEEGSTVQFTIGGINLGAVRGQAILTPLSLVPSAADETNDTVTNIVRLLQTLDDDDDPSNGITISNAVRDAAQVINLNFARTQAQFATDSTTAIAQLTAARTRGARSLVDASTARAHFRGSVFAALAGTYSGTFSGDDSGTWQLTADCDGTLSGSGYSNLFQNSFDISGTASTTGDTTVNGGGVAGGSSFSGALTLDGSFSGNWNNVGENISGTFQGSRTSMPSVSCDGSGSGTGSDTSGDTGTTINNGGTITSNTLLSASIDVFNTVSADFAAVASSDIIVTAPSIAENGAVVPVKVELPPAIGKVWIFVDSNDEKVAAMADFIDIGASGSFSTRVKMKETGNIIAVFEDSQGSLKAAKTNVDVIIGGYPISRCEGASSCNLPNFDASDIRIRASSGLFKILVTNRMDLDDYITSVVIQGDGADLGTVYLTPYASMNPYFSTNYPEGTTEVSVNVNLTGGRSATSSTMAN